MESGIRDTVLFQLHTNHFVSHDIRSTEFVDGIDFDCIDNKTRGSGRVFVVGDNDLAEMSFNGLLFNIPPCRVRKGET